MRQRPGILYVTDPGYPGWATSTSPERRSDLVPHEPGAPELGFARGFIECNDIRHGIQRVDA